MDFHLSTYGHLRLSLKRRMTFDPLESEDGFRIARAFENGFLHFPVARAVAGVAAREIHDHFSGRLPGLRVESNRSVFDPERSPNRMQERAECERDRTLLGG